MNAYTHLLRPLLFQLPADRAHALAHAALSYTPPWDLLGRSLPAPASRLAVDFCGLRLRTPIGLAARVDQDREHGPAPSGLGLRCLTLGSIIARRRSREPAARL